MLVVLLVGCQEAAVAPSDLATSSSPMSVAPSPSPGVTRPAIPEPSLGTAPSGATTEALVVSITDGDTVRVQIDGVEYPVRYIGIDSPETGREHADEATAENESLVAGQTVVLE